MTHSTFVIAMLWLTAWPMAADPGNATTAPDHSIWVGVEWTDLDGRSWCADRLIGQVVVLDFWATWCPPCLAELPTFRRLHARTEAGEPLAVVGIVADRLDRRRLTSFLRRQSVSWPQVHERRGLAGRLPRDFAVTALPTTVVIDHTGRLVARNLRGEALEAAVDALLDATPRPKSK